MWREEVVRQLPPASDAVREVYRRANGTVGFRWRDPATGQFVRAPGAPPRPPRSRGRQAPGAVPAAVGAAPPEPPLADPVNPQEAVDAGGPQAAQALYVPPLPSAPPLPFAPGQDAPPARGAPAPLVDTGQAADLPPVTVAPQIVSIAHIVDAGGSFRVDPGGAIDITFPPPPAPEEPPAKAVLNWGRVVERLRRKIKRQQRRRAGYQAALQQGVGHALGWAEHRRSLLRWRRAFRFFLTVLRLVLRTALERPRGAVGVGFAFLATVGQFFPDGKFLGGQGANATAPGDPPLPALEAPPSLG